MEMSNSNNVSRQQSSLTMTTGESEHELSMKKRGHVAQSRSAQKSHALPRSTSRGRGRPRARSKSRGKSRSSSRVRMGSPSSSAVSDEKYRKEPLKRSGSLNRFSSWSMIRDGKIDERGRCRRHPNIELYRREATNSEESWRMLLQDCPLCSLHDSALNCINDYQEMAMKDSMTLSGDVTSQTNGTDATSPLSGEETSLGSDASSSNDNAIKREKIGLSPNTQQEQIPPPPPKQSSIRTLKALGKMHIDGDDAISTSGRSISSRRSRNPPPPPGRKPVSNLNSRSKSKFESNSSISSLSTKELSKMRKKKYSSGGQNETNGDIEQDIGHSLERLRAERKAARRKLKERQESGQHRNSPNGEESKETFTLPMNDVVRGRSIVARSDDDILGAAAEIRTRARRSLSRSKERKKAAEDLFGGPSISGDELTLDGDAVSVASKGTRTITNPHGLTEPPKSLHIERRSQIRKRRSRSVGGTRTKDRGSVEGHRSAAMNERSSELLINRRREMKQRLAERQNAADYRRVGVGSASQMGDINYHSVNDDGKKEMRRPGRSTERGERGRGRSRSRVREGISRIRSASLKAFRKKDNQKLESDEQTIDSGKISFKSLVSQCRRIRSLSRERHK